MSDLTVIQSDTGPSVYGALAIAGVVVNLTGATVKFQMRRADDRRFTVNAAATVVDEDLGTVRYDWQAGDLAEAGDFVSRWQVTFGDGTIQHTEPENTITIDPA